MFWHLWFPVTLTMLQDTVYQGPRSFSVLLELTCSNCAESILGSASFQLAIDGEDEAIYVDVAAGTTVRQRLLSENTERVPLTISLPSNFLAPCPTGCVLWPYCHLHARARTHTHTHTTALAYVDGESWWLDGSDGQALTGLPFVVLLLLLLAGCCCCCCCCCYSCDNYSW